MSETLAQEIRTLRSLFWSDRDPDGRAFVPLADAYVRAGEVKEALDLLADGMSRLPDCASGHVVATRLYLEQGMHSEAEFAAKRALELDSENTVALAALARIFTERGEEGDAARYRAEVARIQDGLTDLPLCRVQSCRALDPINLVGKPFLQLDAHALCLAEASTLDQIQRTSDVFQQIQADPFAYISRNIANGMLAGLPAGTQDELKLAIDRLIGAIHDQVGQT